MSTINDKRLDRRIVAVCRILDREGKFLGFTLDLTTTGIHIIVPNNFPREDSFTVILHQTREEELNPNITLKIEQVWRNAADAEYDEIGGKIVEVDLEAELKDLVQYCEQKAKEQYQSDYI